MNDIIAQSRPFDPQAFARVTCEGDELTMSQLEFIERRVLAIEEAISLPWPLSWLALARLGRSIRASAELWARPGWTWAEARTEATTAEWLSR